MIQRTSLLAARRRNAGTYLTPAVAVPDGSTKVGVAISRLGWEDLGRDEVVRATVEIAADAGASWRPLGTVGASAKAVLQRDGTLGTHTTLLCRLPHALQGARGLQARVRVEAAGRIDGGVELLVDDAPPPPRPIEEHHSVTYDNDAEATATAATSVTITSFVVGNNANRYMIVGVGSWDATAGDAVVTGVTFNGSGTGWAQIISEQGPTGIGSNNRSTLWGLTAPAVATGNVVATMAGTCAEIGVNALSAFDVDQTTPLGTPVSAEGNASAATVDVGAATNDLVYDCVYANGTTPTVGAGQTQRCSQVITGNSNHLTSTEPGAATVTMSWTGTLDEWVQTAVALKAAAGGISIPVVMHHRMRNF